MTIQAKLLSAIAVSGFAVFAAMSPAQALTTQECSAKYQAAKTAGTLNGQKWNDFRKAQCAADAAAAPAAAPAPAPAPAAAAPAAPAAPKEAAAKPKKESAPAAAPAAPMPVGNAVFPSAVDPKYAKETAGKGRFKTCDDQYNANKATNGNGGLKWIMKGGGYYSECNKKLKGA
jgi:pyruvate/2-oxoglutarate dehydrogenase complex dihydrolipoamide acyltransferase (E2) component